MILGKVFAHGQVTLSQEIRPEADSTSGDAGTFSLTGSARIQSATAAPPG